jgi:hypothetical protein
LPEEDEGDKKKEDNNVKHNQKVKCWANPRFG